MKHEYAFLLSVVGGWLLRGLVQAYRGRESLTTIQMVKMVAWLK